MTPELETLLNLYELLRETPDTGKATMRTAFRKACEQHAASVGVDWREIGRFVESTYFKKLDAENRRTGRPTRKESN